MEYKILDDIRRMADIFPHRTTGRKLTKSERLERWAAVLEAQAERPLRPLMRVEFLSPDQRRMLRDDDTPLTVAHRDPVLQADGLESDRFGDAVTFFGLQEHEAHYLVCDCHYRGSMTATAVAARVRAISRGLA